jgi:hypothetical protein
MKNAMEELLCRGSIFSVKASIPSGRRKLDWKKLGLEVVANPELVSEGQIWLVPREEINKILAFRAKAQAVIEKHGVEFSFGYIVPLKHREQVIKELQQTVVEFDDAVNNLHDHYDELKQSMLNKWHEEAVSISSRTNNADKVFEIMDAVTRMFPTWENFWSGGISWVEYNDLQKMANEFVAASTRGILEKMAEFAKTLKQKIDNSQLSERNMAPIRRWIENMRESISVFQNKKLNEMLLDLEAYTGEGVANDVSVSDKLRNAMRETLDGIVNAATEQVDEIARESINALTSQKRKLDR